MAFTLLAQMAVGAFWWMPWMLTPLWNLVEYDARGLRLAAMLIIGLCLGAGMAASFAHLGTKKNAWRMITHLRKSWLSRELLFALLFAAGWLLTALAYASWLSVTGAMRLVTGLVGAGLIYSMGQVYRLRAVPAWNTWRTNAGFFVTAFLLGLLLMATVLGFESQATGIRVWSPQWTRIGMLVLALLLLRAVIGTPRTSLARTERVWEGLMAAAVLAAGTVFFVPEVTSSWAALLILLIVLAAEGIGRWLFYEARVR